MTECVHTNVHDTRKLQCKRDFFHTYKSDQGGVPSLEHQKSLLIIHVFGIEVSAQCKDNFFVLILQKGDNGIEKLPL